MSANRAVANDGGLDPRGNPENVRSVVALVDELSRCGPETQPGNRDDDDRYIAQRRHERVPFTAGVTLMVEARGRLQRYSGYMLDLSEGGCALRVYSSVRTNARARLRIEIGNTAISVAFVTRWAKAESRGWTLGAEFDQPSLEQRAEIRRLIERARASTSSATIG